MEMAELFGLVLLLLLAAAGCGRQSAEPGTPESTAAAEPQTRLFTDDLGRQVEIPVHPRRVVTSEFSAEALTVGVTPIGLGPNDLKNPFTRDRLAGIDNIGDPPDAEKILELKPDLILFSQFMPDIYPDVMEKIEQIAPVVYISFQDPIYDVLPKVADAVGQPKAAADWIQGYEAERTKAQERVRQSIGDKTVSIFRIEKGRLRIYLSTNFGGYALRSALEAKAPAAVQAEIDKSPPWTNAVQISLEKLPEYAGDILLLVAAGDDDSQAAYREIRQSKLWQSLPAVKNGMVYELDTATYYNADNVTVRETMKEMADMLAAKAP
ncbi:ABC transporter substrate-binding protein [Cohnella sp. CBP 2801]|uniref:ABC transporter substrate-binding protein n=2 Tax=Cohnella zeiphila TaxID=2761120 RepID=A0A7X0VWX3_9BACL|nr:ABC transporter substrate-binding protein [Cohnella zeiphila]